MFCYQCEQTLAGQGCTALGVCGKDPAVGVLQDLLVENLIGIAFYADALHALGVETRDADVCIMNGLFTTGTNVNFDPERHAEVIRESQAVKEKTRDTFLKIYAERMGSPFAGRVPEAATLVPEPTVEAMVRQGEKYMMDGAVLGDDAQSLRSLILFGLKGMAAYAHHARTLGAEDESIYRFLSKGLAALRDDRLGANDLVALAMECGQVNLKCMEILDGAHVARFGHPVPTPVPTGVKKGAAIVVSGHDLADLEALLQQTEGLGITVYTHGEMLPAHGYPGLKRYAHLYGNYGGAWQNQATDFDRFPGAILMTTNCIQKPRATYQDRIFTTGLVAWPGVTHIPDRGDFGPVIRKALELGGFAASRPGKTITVGFARNAVLGAADQIVQAVQNGQIKHFFLVGGCDGAKPGRNYYTRFAERAPRDTVILTLACGKYRLNKLDLGDIGGIPRLLDIGQCNDAYSAIQIALALANVFGCGVNDLPLSLILSWYEQKAVAILLTLLSLGITNIKLGPSLPAFVSPNVLNVLVEKFSLQPITTVEADLQASLAR